MSNIDSHHHFWIYEEKNFNWISREMEILRRNYLPADLETELKANGVQRTVAVQARQSLEETRWLLQLADENKFIGGVVGWVDLCSPQCENQIEALSKHPKLKGIRHIIHDEPDEAFMLKPEFIDGLKSVHAAGLKYDLLIFHRHLPNALKLLEQCDGMPLVLDHIAKPPIAEGKLSPWREGIRSLASFSNLYGKVSGMVTEAKWMDWRTKDFNPYLDVVFEAFGPDRLMFGSDWPVCRLAGEYNQIKEILTDYVRENCPEKESAVFGANAARFYGLDVG